MERHQVWCKYLRKGYEQVRLMSLHSKKMMLMQHIFGIFPSHTIARSSVHNDLDLPRSFPLLPSFTAPATQEVAQAPLTDLEILRALGQSRAGNVCGFVVFNGCIAHILNLFGDIFF